ncbi:RNA-binding S4 domain-containing protein [Roseimaritima ulvae]|uniref:Ribosome-associated protein n=1 Tax=Roseimaritima ulvae TaxID=980254 RepID=A0A5B9QUY5_9BACT|nr:RNA-binding S4 domain-containing protein [Roseimaritima ulvae]QEG41165.1 ribosome-associated protein [Roseimaritima ulvae]
MHDSPAPNSGAPGSDSPITIRLDDFLKFCGLVGTGGQAKVLIQNGEVQVNGQVETRRRKQLVPGDVVELLGERFEVEATE